MSVTTCSRGQQHLDSDSKEVRPQSPPLADCKVYTSRIALEKQPYSWAHVMSGGRGKAVEQVNWVKISLHLEVVQD